MKKYAPLLLAFFVSTALFGQHLVQKADFLIAERAFLIQNPFAEADEFTAFSLVFSAENEVDLAFATAGADGFFSNFERLAEDHHARADDDFGDENRRTHGLVFLEKGTRAIKIRLADGASGQVPTAIEAHFFSPSGGRAFPKTVEKAPETELHNCLCPLPTVVKRNVWCAAGTCPYSATPTPTIVTHLIVHHSAGTGASANWNAVVEAIWDYHVNTNGWADIGYNWLVAPDGTLFEGRQDNIQGAHFCSTNGGTMGVCLLGTFTGATISAAAEQTLIALLTWKSCIRNVDPHATTFHSNSGLDLKTISGHRDGCATECPGDAFYATLPALRDSVAARLAACHLDVSAGEILEKEGLRVYPNPASGGAFFIEIDEKAANSSLFSLFDARGQLIQKQLFSTLGTQRVEVGAAEKGLFFWRLGERAGTIFLE